MVSVTIRNLDEQIRNRLKQRAAANSRSMEAEVREILRGVVGHSDFARSWVDAYRGSGVAELPLPRRSKPRWLDLW
jgi:antitoxin FitA